jgi:hypothetical protein
MPSIYVYAVALGVSRVTVCFAVGPQSIILHYHFTLKYSLTDGHFIKYILLDDGQ